MRPDLYPFIAVLDGVVKHCRKDDAEQQRCHDAALLRAVIDRERVGDATFIDDTADYTIVKRADDVNNLVCVTTKILRLRFT